MEYKEFKKRKESDDENKKLVKSTITLEELKPPPLKQVKLSHFSNAAPKQEQVNKLIQRYIVNEMKPLRTVEQTSFVE